MRLRAGGAGRRRPRRTGLRVIVTAGDSHRPFPLFARTGPRAYEIASGPDYHGRMALSLVVGPAHAGKVALLLERYLDALERDPWLIVPNRGDVERVERDLLRRRSALLSGRIGTFDDLFEHIAFGDPQLARRDDAQRSLAIRRAIARTELDGLAASAGSSGFADALGSARSSSRRSSSRIGSTGTCPARVRVP